MAGSEAAWALANAGVPVVLHEMRPVVKTDAHKSDGLAELVCSNSFRSDDKDQNAVACCTRKCACGLAHHGGRSPASGACGWCPCG